MLPTNLKPRSRSSLLSASDSFDVAGRSFIRSWRFLFGRPPTKPQTCSRQSSWGFVDGRPIKNRHERMKYLGHVQRIRRPEQRPQRVRLQIRGQHDHLCPHASGRHGERPPGNVFSSQGSRPQEVTLCRVACDGWCIVTVVLIRGSRHGVARQELPATGVVRLQCTKPRPSPSLRDVPPGCAPERDV